MAATRCHPLRPSRTTSLIQRLADSDCSPEEKRALGAWTRCMIYIFERNPKLYTAEAAAISLIVTNKEYHSLISAFANTIIQGTTDGDILDSNLLMNFGYALRRAPTVLSAENAKLGSVLDSLKRRLDKAGDRAEWETQYQLVCMLSTILDAMVDIQIAGLDREELHEPLLRQLKALKVSQEPRLAQAAGYAYQALRYVPDNEGPYQALLRHSWTLIQATAKISGAVPAMDPMRIIDATSELMKMFSLFKSLIEAAQDVHDASQIIKNNVVESMGNLSKLKGWYMALRYTRMLIDAKDFQMLQDFIQQRRCGDEEPFWCGLYAQLEQTWVTGDEAIRGQVSQWKDIASERHHCWRRWRNKEDQRSPQPFNVQQVNVKALPGELLEEAWSKCEDAQRFYADMQIREYYRQGRQLEIRRLSGSLLDMDQCYINLAVIEHSRGDDKDRLDNTKTEQRQSAFTLFNRLKVQTPNTDKSVTLPKLFDERKSPDGTMARPKRILIRGRAGVGKTTLCKKIVHDFLYARLWAEYFDRILWMPLRRLKGTLSLDKLLEEYLALESDRDCLVLALRKTIFDPIDKRTLLLLDGLDEICGERQDPGIDLAEKLTSLLNRPNVIITSRPYAVNLPDLNPFDLELETVGFLPAQVQEYVTKVVKNRAMAEGIQAFIDSHWLIQGLVQIPIQLDALCYSWHNDLRSGGVPKTMTALYQSIELKLWKKDILQLGKKKDGRLFSEAEVQKLRTRSQIKPPINNELELLEFLAFTGLVNDIIEFDQDVRDKVYEQSHLSEMSDNTLDKVSFLRTSDPSSEHENRGYHFLHLTFQEFFAAHYFARHWISKKPLLYLRFSSVHQQSEKQIPPEKFLQQEKYSGRYDIFWRFVVGLLSAEGEEQLCRLFEQIEDEPRDLLGPAHQRLLIHCFSEVARLESRVRLEHYRAEMEYQCQQWSLHEYKLLKKMYLCREREFPEQVLVKMLKMELGDARADILRALDNRSPLPPNLLELICTFLCENTDDDVRRAAAETLGRQSSLSESILQALVSRLEDTDNNVRWAAAEALGRQSSFSESVLQALMSQLEHTNKDVRQAAAETLGRQSSLSESILQALVSRLEHTNNNVRSAAAGALRRQSSLLESILQALVSRLEHTNHDVRSAAAGALGRQSSLSESVLQTLVSRLEDTDQSVRSAAANALGRQSSLSESILQALVSRLEDTDQSVRLAAAHALDRQSSLSESILQALVSLLEHTNNNVRWAAVHALGGQSSLSESVLQVLVSRLEDIDNNIRSAAAYALGQQSSLSESVLQALVSRLEDTNNNVRWATANALGKRSSLSESILQVLVSRLEDTDQSVSWAIADMALGHQSSLSESILQALVSRLEDTNNDVRVLAAAVLSWQSSLPESILQALVSVLEHMDPYVTQPVTQALGQQSSLSESVLQALISRLEHTDQSVRYRSKSQVGYHSGFRRA
ncbi:hypothetical protein EYZ11_008830 [Aspergillus tanneri]|uniref:NACHT domain-containing protein n=1 Tax=Aspergillus tanneri TaxID=1220188 RepID=A0A4S3J9V9_9EURO|nr:hypothetical protein EYZ11_008830 [Aspergillus tanneri]